MAAPEQVGVADIQESIATVLGGIQADHRLGRTSRHPDVELGFDIDGAVDLQPPDERGEAHAGRSKTPVTLNGEEFAELEITVLEPGQGTGDRWTFIPDQVKLPDWVPDTPGVRPRSREGIYIEAYMPIATHAHDRVHRMVGHLNLLGIQDPYRVPKKVVSLGAVGQSPGLFERNIDGERGASAPSSPDFTITTEWRESDAQRADEPDAQPDRLGAHTALYNATDVLQIAGSLAIHENPSPIAHVNLLRGLAHYPFNVHPAANADPAAAAA